ncbi:MAG: hypothetical protein ABFE08_02770 [Armatimonadia bacterium]
MRTVAVAAITAAALLMLASVCFGQAACPPGPEVKIWGGLESKPKIAEAYQPQTAQIGIGSFRLFELPRGAAGYTLAEREVAVYNRLTEVLSHGPVSPSKICVGRVRSAPTIYVGNYRFVSVYASDVKGTGMTQEQLAQQWRDQLAQVLPRITGPTGAAPAAGAAPVAGATPAGPLTNAGPALPDTYEVAVGGVFLFRLRDRDGSPSLEARGKKVEAQVVSMLSDGRKGRLTAQAVLKGDEWTVKYGDVQVVTVTSGDAAANGNIAIEALANQWAATLNAALAKMKSPTGG